MIHPFAEGKNLLDTKDANGDLIVKTMLDVKDGIMRYQSANKEAGDTAPRENIAALTTFSKWGWLIGSSSYTEEFTRDSRTVLGMLGLGGLILLFVVVAVSIYVTRGITRQLGGEPHYAMEVSRRIAAGDLSTRVEVANATQDSVMVAIQTMQSELQRSVTEVRHSANSIAAAAQSMTTAGSQVEKSSSAQSEAASAVAAAVEQTSVSISETARNASMADETATRARGDIEATLRLSAVTTSSPF